MEQLYLFEDEEWRDVVGYEGLYQVSNLGRVRSLVQDKSRRKKIMKQNHKSSGYMTICLCKGIKPKFVLVHRLVANVTSFIFPPSDSCP